MNKQIASAALTLIGALAASQQVSGQRKSNKRHTKSGGIVTDKSGYTVFHGTAPDGGTVNSWSGKLLSAKGGKSAAIKFIDGNGKVIGIMSQQTVREMAVAAEQGLKMFSQQDSGANGQ